MRDVREHAVQGSTGGQAAVASVGCGPLGCGDDRDRARAKIAMVLDYAIRNAT